MPSKATLSVLSGLLFIALFMLTHFTLNASESEPVGLYLITNRPISRNSLVLLKDPLKEIVAVPGDTVQWAADGIRVNGQLLKNSKVPVGSPYPPYPYATLKLAPDQYLAMGQHPLSWDSRYIGAIPASVVAKTVKPLWVR